MEDVGIGTSGDSCGSCCSVALSLILPGCCSRASCTSCAPCTCHQPLEGADGALLELCSALSLGLTNMCGKGHFDL